MSKYKSGDKVILIKPSTKSWGIGWVGMMDKYDRTIGTVKIGKNLLHGFYIKEVKGWVFSDAMCVPLNEMTKVLYL